MILYYVIQNVSPGIVHFVETTISGFCLFTKFESRAKMFTLEEADELVIHLQKRKSKNHYAKIQAEGTKEIPDGDKKIFFHPPGNEVSDHKSDPQSEETQNE